MNKLRSKNDNNKYPEYIVAQYGSNFVPASDLALLRGTGQYNPSPKFEQSTYRGPAYDQALNYFTYTNNLQNPTQVPIESLAQSLNYKSVIYPSDIENLRQKEVGTSFFHPEQNGSWKKPDFQGSRGASRYQAWAVQSLQMTPTVLMNLLFSDENVEYLQNKLIDEVYAIRKIKIQKQSIDELLIIMRNKYIYAISGYLFYPDKTAVYARGDVHGKNGNAYYNGGLEQQLMQLNKSILEECVKQVLSGIDQYMLYYKDISTLPMPLENPVLTSEKGSRVLMENVGFHDGKAESIAMSSFNERFNII
jgi:hypothetical protein